MILQGFNVSNEPITRGEFDSQLILVHETIKISNERNDIKHNALLERLDTVAEQNKEALEMIKTGVVAHSNAITELKEHQTKTKVYWGLIKWIGGPSVLAVWLSMIGYAISQLTGQ